MAEKIKKIFTVSAVNSLVKEAIANSLPSRLIVSGEITDLKIHHSGHCYFSLKDENSKLPCVMWKSSLAKVKFEPENGMAVLATGFVDVYPPQGKFQFYADKLEPAGIGQLQLAFEQLVRKLEVQGLFKDEHKKPLPKYPQRIGVVTSPTGAAVEDIRDSVFNRWPCVKLYLYPVLVQGDDAARTITNAIKDINKRNAQLKLDLLIVGRGGGSMEDLWAFNAEILARAIFESKIPIISAVGHETDTTIADLVADARASTPTKAGIVAVPDINEVLANIDSLKLRIRNNILARIELAFQNLETIMASGAFRNPMLPVQIAAQKLDELQSALAENTSKTLTHQKDKINRFYEKIVALEPHKLIGVKKIQLARIDYLLNTSIAATLNLGNLKLAKLQNSLRAMDPRATLNRGYSLKKKKKTNDNRTHRQKIY